MSTCSSFTSDDGTEDSGYYYLIEGVEMIEEYEPGGYHPVLLGDLFDDGRYKIVYKLGYGGYSMTWLARDQMLDKYVAIKIMKAFVEDDEEQQIALRVSALMCEDPEETNLLSILLDSFTIHGPNGTHKCLVVEPGRMSFSDAKEESPVSNCCTLRFETHRAVMGQIIQAVAKLHEKGVVHGDLRAGNIMFHIPGDINNLSVEELYKQYGEPITEPVKHTNGGPIPDSIPKEVCHPIWLGTAPDELPVEEARSFLCDFGESYFPAETKRDYSNTLKLNGPPEARFSDDPLSFPSDIWTLGCLLFKIIAIGPLFRTIFEKDDDITSQHVEACGKLPEEWWSKWKARAEYYQENGTPIADEPESLERRFDFGCQRGRKIMDATLICDEERRISWMYLAGSWF